MPQTIDVPNVGLIEFPDEMTDEDISSAIQKNIIPQSQKASLKEEQRKLNAEPEPGLGSFFLEAAGQPFVTIPKPEAQPDDSGLMKFGKGLAQSGIGLLEGIESPLGVSAIAASAIPVIGPAIGRIAAGGFGASAILNGFKQAAEAYASGDLEKAGKAIGDLVGGSAVLRSSVVGTGGAKGEAAPLAKAAVAQSAKVLDESARLPAPSETKLLIEGQFPEAPIEPPPPEPPIVPAHGEPVPTITGIRNKIVDQERSERELPEAEPVIRRQFGPIWDEALEKIDEDPLYQDRLLSELRSQPRAITDLEDAALLQRQVDLQNQFDKTQQDLIDAFGSGSEEAKVEAQTRFNALSDQLLDLYNIGKKAGTETARGLSARRMISNQDFTLGRMVTQARAARGGRELEPEEMTKIEEIKKEIDSTQLALDAYRAKPKIETKGVDIDEQGLKLEADAIRAKSRFSQDIFEERLDQRTAAEKAQDFLVKWRRGFLLSSPITLAKLTSAAVQRMIFNPVEEVIGAGIGKLIPEVAAKARNEGGLRTSAEAKAITHFVTRGMSDAYQVLTTGKSNLDIVFGDERPVDHSVIDFFGNLHGALKAPTRRASFARSFEKLIKSDMERGIDVTDPMVQMRNAVLAYKEAQKSIFLQDNMVVDAYKRGLSRFKQAEKDTGKPSASGKALATVAETLLPIVRVPTNIVAEALQYAVGSVTGLTRLALAMRKGVEKLSEDDANLIMRELKKGSIGATFFLLGFLNPDMFGGYFQRGQKREPDDVKYGGARIMDEDIPRYLLHNPLLETLQLGATVRRVSESKLKRKDQEEQGVSSGIMAGALGLIDEVPFVREMTEVAKAFDPHDRSAFFGELTKSIMVPQLLQWIAGYMDQNDQGEPTPRKPEGILEHIETGIPGLREEVPEKSQPKLFKGK